MVHPDIYEVQNLLRREGFEEQPHIETFTHFWDKWIYPSPVNAGKHEKPYKVQIKIHDLSMYFIHMNYRLEFITVLDSGGPNHCELSFIQNQQYVNIPKALSHFEKVFNSLHLNS